MHVLRLAALYWVKLAFFADVIVYDKNGSVYEMCGGGGRRKVVGLEYVSVSTERLCLEGSVDVSYSRFLVDLSAQDDGDYAAVYSQSSEVVLLQAFYCRQIIHLFARK